MLFINMSLSLSAFILSGFIFKKITKTMIERKKYANYKMLQVYQELTIFYLILVLVASGIAYLIFKLI